MHEGKDGALPSYEGTYTFTPGWKTPNGGNTVGPYALNFYWQPGREITPTTINASRPRRKN